MSLLLHSLLDLCGSLFFGEIFAYVTVFHPIIQVVTLHLDLALCCRPNEWEMESEAMSAPTERINPFNLTDLRRTKSVMLHLAGYQCCLLGALHSRSMLVYLRDRYAYTIVCAATLR